MVSGLAAAVRPVEPARESVTGLAQRGRAAAGNTGGEPGILGEGPGSFFIEDTTMRKITLFLIALSLFALSAPAQSGSDSSKADGQRQKRSGQKFVDANGDGIDDRVGEQGKGMRRGKDRFVDADGDGICDGRASGLGFRRGSGGSGSFMGGDSKGKGIRQGGKR